MELKHEYIYKIDNFTTIRSKLGISAFVSLDYTCEKVSNKSGDDNSE